MDSLKNSRDIAALARQSIEQALSSAETAALGATPSSKDADTEDTLTSTRDLIDAYFSCEDSGERDLVYDALLACPFAETESFFVAMAQHDQDPFLRVHAAAYLAKKSVPGAWSLLEAELKRSNDATLVYEVLSTAFEIDSERGFAWAVNTFDDPGRTSRIRCAAMRVLNIADAPRASAMFLSHLSEWVQRPNPPQDLIERALSTIAQERPPGAAARVQGLLDTLMMRTTSGVSEAIREDLCSMLDESRLLLQLA